LMHHGWQLYQQYLADQYARVKSQRLTYVKNEQSRLRGNKRWKVKESLMQGDIKNSGRPKILLSLHTGSDRYMYKKYEDGMAIVREKGKPRLFVTTTMIPQCKAMMAQLKPGQIPYDRPDILCRAFKIMNDAILDEIIKQQLFGEVEAYLTTIEFQKRGAPHSHTLIWLKDFDDTPHGIDNIISAEIDLVMNYMIHTCSLGCCPEGECIKHFPKAFSDETIMGDGAFPSYRRRSPRVVATEIGQKRVS